MNEIEELDVSVGPDGRISIRVRGVSGPRCLAVTKALEDRLGVVTSREHTSEFDEVESEREATDTVFTKG